MFASFLSKDNNALKKFLSVVLGVKIESGGYLSVKREYKHTDLYISNSEYDIVIENKIKSGINGIKQKQEDNKGCAEEESQLTHYIDAIAPEGDGGKRKNKVAYFFLVAPDYNLRTITPLVEKYGKKGSINLE